MIDDPFETLQQRREELWAASGGRPSRVFESSEGHVCPMTVDEVAAAVAQLEDAITGR
jgi:hypothetical protein